MARKKRHEEHENHERWLVSYADFITLLFAFFVVMYALSSVNEGKYRVLSDSLVSAFNSPQKDIESITMPDPIQVPPDMTINILSPMNPSSQPRPPIIHKKSEPLESSETASEPVTNPTDQKNLDNISDQLSLALNKMIEKDLIKVNKNGDGIDVEINSSILFNSGSAQLQPQAVPVLTEIARIIRDFPNAIRVEGYTDDIPIDTPIYASNWELSAGRAASVVHLFGDERVDPFRMSATGYGEYRPIAANTTAAGRNANRRVVVMILAPSAEKPIDRGALPTLKATEKPVTNVNLDARLPFNNNQTSNTRAPVINRSTESSSLNSQTGAVLNGPNEKNGDFLENISPQTTASQVPPRAASQAGGGR